MISDEMISECQNKYKTVLVELIRRYSYITYTFERAFKNKLRVEEKEFGRSLYSVASSML